MSGKSVKVEAAGSLLPLPDFSWKIKGDSCPCPHKQPKLKYLREREKAINLVQKKRKQKTSNKGSLTKWGEGGRGIPHKGQYFIVTGIKKPINVWPIFKQRVHSFSMILTSKFQH